MINDILTYGLIGLIGIMSLFWILLYLNINVSKLVYISTIFLFFPIYIQFLGKDALTTGSIFIIVLFITYMTESIKYRGTPLGKGDLLIYTLIFLGLASTIIAMCNGFLERNQFGPAIRQYVGFATSLLYFLVIKNYWSYEHQQENYYETVEKHIEKMLNMFLLLLSVQIVFAIIIKYFPQTTSYLSMFGLMSTEARFDTTVYDAPGAVKRAYTTVITPEQFGEILAFMSPILVYKIIRYKNILWPACFILFLLGILFAITRSGIILFLIGVPITILYNLRERFGRSFFLMYGLFVTSLMIVFFAPSIITPVIVRFDVAKETYFSTGQLFTTINRDNFPDFLNYVITNLSLFGNSLFQNNFHNLYITILHQFGIIGFVFYFIIFFSPFVLMIKRFIDSDNNKNKALIFSCLVSMILFYMNEAKFEFNRDANYQQICWGIFATYYLLATNIPPKET